MEHYSQLILLCLIIGFFTNGPNPEEALSERKWISFGCQTGSSKNAAKKAGVVWSGKGKGIGSSTKQQSAMPWSTRAETCSASARKQMSKVSKV